jgi:REP-associated tyrosine transposase
MSRPLRIEYPGAWYHVMNRGRRGEDIFSDREDYQLFIALLQETSAMFDIKISAYCLMSNQYHLLVQTPAANLSRSMRHINGVYTQRYNRRKNIDGQLFRGRYKCVLVEEDSHLLEILRYIHRNPLRANMCASVGNYPWSSHQGYLSGAKKWRWLHKEFPLEMFSQKQSQAIRQYGKFVQDEDSDEITGFFTKKNPALFFGSQDFIERIKARFHPLKRHAEVPLSKQLAPTIAEIKRMVCLSYKVKEQTLDQSRRGQVNEPRNAAIYLARKRCGLRLDEIGREFGLEKYSSVSSIVTRTEKQLSRDKQMRNRIGKISEEIAKSQAKI